MRITRQQFLRVGGAAAASTLLHPFSLAAAEPDTFCVALIADPHIIDYYYHGW